MQVTAPLPSDAGERARPGFLASLTLEHAIWMTTFGVALLARTWMLGSAPLNNLEAVAANASLTIARGGTAILQNPLFGGLQAGLFAVAGANEFSARLIAAIAGAALCLAPITLRDHLGRRAALFMGGFMLFSPTLWHVSRLSDGATLAWVIALVGWAFWRRRNPIGVAVGLGLLVACGSDGALPLIGVTALSIMAGPAGAFAVVSVRGVLVGLLAAFLGSTLGLWNLAGMGDALNGLASSITGVFRSGSMPFWRALLGFGVYEAILITGAVVEFARWQIHRAILKQLPPGAGEGDADARPRGEWLALAGFGLAIVLIDQSRAAHTLVPLTLACAALTSLLADRVWNALNTDGRWQAEGVAAGLALVFLIVAEMGVRQYAGSGDTKWLLLAVLAIFVVSAGGIGLTLIMPAASAARGALIAIWLVLSISTFGSGFALTQSRADNTAEPYVTEAVTNEARALQSGIEEIATRAYGDKFVMPVEAHDSAPAWMRWLLRDQKFISFAQKPSNPAAALMPAALAFSSEYGYVANALDVTERNGLGVVRCRQSGDRQDCQAVARWLVLRDAGSPSTNQWTLYIRQDIAEKASGQTWSK